MFLADIEQEVRKLRITKKYKELSLILYFLMEGKKPSFLWDLGNVITSDLLKLKIFFSDLVVINISGDYLVSTSELIKQHFQDLNMNFPLIVDISCDRKEPQIATSEIIVDQKCMTVEVMKQISDSAEEVIDLPSKESWNISTLFGILLGYPVVYYYDISNENNCLSNRDLLVHKIGIKDIWATSFSVPANIEVGSRISQWAETVINVSTDDIIFQTESVNLHSVVL